MMDDDCENSIPGPSSIPSTKNNSNSSQFALSRIIEAHKLDVKKTIGIPTGSILTAGRDGYLKLWTER